MPDLNEPNPATLHQAFQGFPKIDSPMVDTATGFVTQPWHRLLIRLWQMVGGSRTTLQSTGFLALNPDGSIATITNAGSGETVGTIGLPAPSAAQAALASLAFEAPPAEPVPASSQVVIFPPPTEPQRDFSSQLVMAVPPEPQTDFSTLAVMAPPPEPLPDPLLSLALNPLAGLA